MMRFFRDKTTDFHAQQFSPTRAAMLTMRENRRGEWAPYYGVTRDPWTGFRVESLPNTGTAPGFDWDATIVLRGPRERLLGAALCRVWAGARLQPCHHDIIVAALDGQMGEEIEAACVTCLQGNDIQRIPGELAFYGTENVARWFVLNARQHQRHLGATQVAQVNALEAAL